MSGAHSPHYWPTAELELLLLVTKGLDKEQQRDLLTTTIMPLCSERVLATHHPFHPGALRGLVELSAEHHDLEADTSHITREVEFLETRVIPPILDLAQMLLQSCAVTSAARWQIACLTYFGGCQVRPRPFDWQARFDGEESWTTIIASTDCLEPWAELLMDAFRRHFYTSFLVWDATTNLACVVPARVDVDQRQEEGTKDVIVVSAARERLCSIQPSFESAIIDAFRMAVAVSHKYPMNRDVLPRDTFLEPRVKTIDLDDIVLTIDFTPADKVLGSVGTLIGSEVPMHLSDSSASLPVALAALSRIAGIVADGPHAATGPLSYQVDGLDAEISWSDPCNPSVTAKVELIRSLRTYDRVLFPSNTTFRFDQQAGALPFHPAPVALLDVLGADAAATWTEPSHRRQALKRLTNAIKTPEQIWKAYLLKKVWAEESNQPFNDDAALETVLNDSPIKADVLRRRFAAQDSESVSDYLDLFYMVSMDQYRELLLRAGKERTYHTKAEQTMTTIHGRPRFGESARASTLPTSGRAGQTEPELQTQAYDALMQNANTHQRLGKYRLADTYYRAALAKCSEDSPWHRMAQISCSYNAGRNLYMWHRLRAIPERNERAVDEVQGLWRDVERLCLAATRAEFIGWDGISSGSISSGIVSVVAEPLLRGRHVPGFLSWSRRHFGVPADEDLILGQEERICSPLDDILDAYYQIARKFSAVDSDERDSHVGGELYPELLMDRVVFPMDEYYRSLPGDITSDLSRVTREDAGLHMVATLRGAICCAEIFRLGERIISREGRKHVLRLGVDFTTTYLRIAPARYLDSELALTNPAAIAGTTQRADLLFYLASDEGEAQYARDAAQLYSQLGDQKKVARCNQIIQRLGG